MKYVGSKNRLSKEIAPIIQSYINDSACKGYIEPFVGGANMIDKIDCKEKYGFDNHKYLIALLKKTQKGTGQFPEEISEETYNDVKAKFKSGNSEYDDWFIGLTGFCSFGGKWFGGYPRSFKSDGITPRNMTNEIIRNIKKQSCNLKGICFECRDFRTIGSEIADYVIYCDPPYKGTTGYGKQSFSYDEFYEWCRELSKNNIVLVSEYWMPEDFECIWKGKLKCTLDKATRTDRVEKLFIYKSCTSVDKEK